MNKYYENHASLCINEWRYQCESQGSLFKKQVKIDDNKLLAITKYRVKSLINLTDTDFTNKIRKYEEHESICFSFQEEKEIIKRFQHLKKKLLSSLLETPMTKIPQNLLYKVLSKANHFQNLSFYQCSREIVNNLTNVNFNSYDHVYEFTYKENSTSFVLHLDITGYFTIIGTCHSAKEVIKSYGLNEELPAFIKLSREGV